MLCEFRELGISSMVPPNGIFFTNKKNFSDKVLQAGKNADNLLVEGISRMNVKEGGTD